MPYGQALLLNRLLLRMWRINTRSVRELDLELTTSNTDARGRRPNDVSNLRGRFSVGGESTDDLDRRWREPVTATMTHGTRFSAAAHRVRANIIANGDSP